MSGHPEFVLAVHPSSRGFGWVLFEGPAAPYDWGTVDSRLNKNVRALLRLEKLLTRYTPDVLVLEAFEDASSQRRPRIRRLCRRMCQLAARRGANVFIVARGDVRSAFGTAVTREEVARTVAEHLEPLRAYLPRPRRIWESEPAGLAIFAAAGAALAFYAKTQSHHA